MHPKQLVNLLDQIFAEFDSLADHFGLEKIKTIGDAYMVAGGIPEPFPNSLEAIANMALAMQKIIKSDIRFDKLGHGWSLAHKHRHRQRQSLHPGTGYRVI